MNFANAIHNTSTLWINNNSNHKRRVINCISSFCLGHVSTWGLLIDFLVWQLRQVLNGNCHPKPSQIILVLKHKLIYDLSTCLAQFGFCQNILIKLTLICTIIEINLPQFPCATQIHLLCIIHGAWKESNYRPEKHFKKRFKF